MTKTWVITQGKLGGTYLLFHDPASGKLTFAGLNPEPLRVRDVDPTYSVDRYMKSIGELGYTAKEVTNDGEAR